jgi:small subunit ribosomal protein S2
MQPGDLATIDNQLKLNGRIERDGWVAQARAMIEAA